MPFKPGNTLHLRRNIKKYYCVECRETNPDKFHKKVKNHCIVHAKELYSLYRKNQIKNKNSYTHKYPIRIKLSFAKQKALKRDLIFDLDEKFIKELEIKQDNKCIYSGISFDPTIEEYSMSIDRIDSSRGYTKDNVQLVCVCVNTMKLDLKESEFFDFIKLISNHRKLL